MLCGLEKRRRIDTTTREKKKRKEEGWEKCQIIPLQEKEIILNIMKEKKLMV